MDFWQTFIWSDESKFEPFQPENQSNGMAYGKGNI